MRSGDCAACVWMTRRPSSTGCACCSKVAAVRWSALLSRFEPDVVIADLQLRAEESGLSLLREARQQARPINTILITANSAPMVRTECQQLGIRYLRKPVDATLLLAAISPADAA